MKRLSTWRTVFLVVALIYSFQYTLAEERVCDPGTQFCFTVIVPSVNASSGQNNATFRLEAPSSVGWVALGIGSGMVGSYQMIAWPNSDGSITISQRAATGYRQPLVSSHDLTLDPSSTISNGLMIAVIKRPLQVQGSTLDGSSSQDFVWAVSGTSPNNAAEDADLRKHDTTGQKTLSSSAMTASSNSTGTLDASSDSFGSLSKTQKLIFAHAGLMSFAWLILSPTAVFIVKFGRKLLPQWWFSLHWWFQVFGTTLCVILGFMCVQIPDIDFPPSSILNAHSGVGYTIFIGTLCQVMIGYIHHKLFKADRGYTPWWTKLHWWVGRSLQLLALIQIPIGFNLYGFDPNIYFAYLVYLTAVMILFVIFSIRLYVQKKRESIKVYNKVAESS